MVLSDTGLRYQNDKTEGAREQIRDDHPSSSDRESGVLPVAGCLTRRPPLNLRMNSAADEKITLAEGPHEAAVL